MYSQRRQSAADKHDRSLALPGHDLFLRNPLLLMSRGNGDLLNREKYRQFSHMIMEGQQSYSSLHLPLIQWQRGANNWSELDRVFPAQKGRVQMNEPARPGELRRGSIIQKFEKPQAPAGMESAKFDRVPAREKGKTLQPQPGMEAHKGRIFTRVTEITPYQQQIQPDDHTPESGNAETFESTLFNSEPVQTGLQFTANEDTSNVYEASRGAEEIHSDISTPSFSPESPVEEMNVTRPVEDDKTGPMPLDAKAWEQAPAAIPGNGDAEVTPTQGLPLNRGMAEKVPANKAGLAQPAAHTVQRMPDKKAPDSKPPDAGKKPSQDTLPVKPADPAHLRVAQPVRTDKAGYPENPAAFIHAKPVFPGENTGISPIKLPQPGSNPKMIYPASTLPEAEDRVDEAVEPAMQEQQSFAPGEEFTGSETNVVTSYPANNTGKPAPQKDNLRQPARAPVQPGWDSPKNLVLRSLPSVETNVFTAPQSMPSEPETRRVVQQWTRQVPEAGSPVSLLPVPPGPLSAGMENQAPAIFPADSFAIEPADKPVEARLPALRKSAIQVQREVDVKAPDEPVEEKEDLDQLAEKVLPYVKRLIEIERERTFGR